MGLNPVNGGLHRLKNDSVQPAKVELTILPGDELEVSDDVAAQLAAASTHFVDPATVPEPARQIVKNEHGEPTGWSDGSPVTDAEVAALGLGQVAPDPDTEIVVETPKAKAAKPKKAPAKRATPTA